MIRVQTKFTPVKNPRAEHEPSPALGHPAGSKRNVSRANFVSRVLRLTPSAADHVPLHTNQSHNLILSKVQSSYV